MYVETVGKNNRLKRIEAAPTYEFGPVVDLSNRALSKSNERYFGPRPDTFRPITYSEINVGAQMRTFFDPEEQENLSNSIRSTGLQNPLIVFEMDEELKDWYVNLTNEVWDANIDPSSFTKNEDGMYMVLVAGERRYRAIDTIIGAEQLNPDDVAITCQVRTCGSLQDMMGSQAAENMYNAPRPFQYATIIHEVYQLGLEAGLYETEAEFIRDHSPAGRAATKNALLFYKMPPFVRDYVAQEKLGYGHSLILHEYYDAYQRKLETMDISEEQKTQLLQKRLESRILKVIAEGWTISKLEGVIPGWMSELDFYQPGFFEAEFHDASRDQLHREREKIRDTHRELINSTGRSLGRHVEAVLLLLQVDEDMSREIQPNIRRQLVRAKEAYRSLADAYVGNSIGKLAAECAASVEQILDQA